MNRRDYEEITKIRRAAERAYSKVRFMEFDDFKEDEDVQDICAIQCQKIGNSVAKLSQDVKDEFSDVNWAGMYGTRCVIAHNYGEETYDLKKLWNTLSIHIPELIEICNQILAQKGTFSENRRSRKHGLKRMGTGILHRNSVYGKSPKKRGRIAR